MKKLEKTIKKLKCQDIIYHYTDTPTALEHILSDGKLKLSLLNKTNDPLEYKNWGFGGTFWGDDEEIEEKLFKVWEEMRKRTREKLRFSSFCHNENLKEHSDSAFSKYDDFYQPIIDKLGCTNSRMWSQYGEGNKGICLAFSIEELEREIEKKIKKVNIDDCFYYSSKMKYKGLPVVDFKNLVMNGNKIQKEGVENYIEKFIENNWGGLFFTKHKDYKDESEHRIVIYDSMDKFEYIDISSSLEAIIVGDKFNKVYTPLIKEFANDYGVMYKKLHWEKGKIFFLHNF